jgi:hypothetical protein
MSDYLLIVDPERKPLDPDEVRQVLEDIPGVTAIRRNQSSVLGVDPVGADYTYGGHPTHISLIHNHDHLRLEQCNEVSLRLAAEFGRAYAARHGRALHVFNAQYDFHQKLDAATTPESLARQIAATPFAGQSE